MNRDQFEKMMAAARDIVIAHRTAAVTSVLRLDPLTVEWAQSLVTCNPFKFRQSPLQDRIQRLYDDDPRIGLTSVEIQNGIGQHGPNILTAIHSMVANKKLTSLHWWHRSRYFASPAAAEAGKAAFEAEKAAWRPTRAPGIPRLAKTPLPRRAKKEVPMDDPKPEDTTRVDVSKIPKPPKPPKAPRVNLGRKQTAFNPDRRATRAPPKVTPPEGTVRMASVVAPKGEVIHPPHVKVQYIPHKVDTRFQPDPPSGDTFAADWKRKRGEA